MHKNSEGISKRQLSEERRQQDAAVNGMRQEPVHYGLVTVANVLKKLNLLFTAGYFLSFFRSLKYLFDKAIIAARLQIS